MNERERFDEWYSYSHKPYLPDQVDTAWQAWQASRADAMAWRPIESAPRDATDILIAWDKVVVPAWYCGMPGENCWYEYEKGPANPFDRISADTPTHWMPLPNPPK